MGARKPAGREVGKSEVEIDQSHAILLRLLGCEAYADPKELSLPGIDGLGGMIGSRDRLVTVRDWSAHFDRRSAIEI